MQTALVHNIASATSELAISFLVCVTDAVIAPDAMNTAIACCNSRSALSTAPGAAVDIPVEVLVADLEEHSLEASNPDPDALAEILFKIQDALDPNDDGVIDTKVFTKVLAAGITEKWPALSKFSAAITF